MPNQKKLAIKAIEQLFNSQIQPVENTDLAQYLLTHSYSGPSKTISADIASKQGAESEGHSLLSKTFDLLSTGLYGTTNVVNDTINAVKEANRKNKGAGLGERLLNTLGGETADILGSIGKNTVGSLARGAGDVTDILGQVTGLDKAPIVGGLENKVESGLSNTADKLTPRMLGSSVLDKQFGIKNKPLKYGLGFVSDVVLDPTTYIPGANVVGALKKGKEAKLLEQGFRADDAASALEKAAATGVSKPELFTKPSVPKLTQPASAEMAIGQNMIPMPKTITPPVASPSISNKPGLLQSILGEPTGQDLTDLQALRRTDNATRAANVRWGKPIDWHDIPEMSREEKAAFADRMRDAQMAKKGIVSDGKGNISITASTDVIENIRNGITPRFGPMPVGAEGEAAAKAQEIASRAAKNLTKPSRKGRSVKELTPADQVNLFNSTYSEAARMVNETASKAPKKVLNPKQQAAANSISAWAKGTKTKLDKAVLGRELSKIKGLNKSDVKAITRDFFPPEPIRNPAVTRYGRQQVEVLARQMLKTAEDHLINQGVQPTYWNGMRVRLSDILEEVGQQGTLKNASEIMDAFMTKDVHKLTDPVVREAVSKALARRSLSMSDMLSELSKKTQQVKGDVLNTYNYPNPVARQILDALPKQGAETAKSLGATSVEAKAMSEHIRSIIDSNRLPEERLFDQLGKETATALMEGKGTQEQIIKGSQIIGKMLEQTPAQASKDITGHAAVDGFFARMSTWMGRPEVIKRYSQDAFLFAEDNAAYRTRFLRHLSTNYTPDQLKRGFTLAQQPDELRLVSQGLEADEKVIEAANIYKNYFNWMLGSTGFDKIEDLGGVAAVRSSMVMTDVNKHLKAVGSKFQFTDISRGSFKRKGTFPRDYSKSGVGWMHSWENASPVEYGQDPISFMHDMDLAIQRTVAEYATFDEFARRFGARVDDAHFNPSVHKAIIPNPRLAGYKFHPEIQQQMLRLIKDLETGAWMPSSPMMRNVIKGTRVWKSSVTIYRPVHHIRNVIGDAFNMWLAGHNNPTAFSRAIKVLETQKSRYAEALKSNSMEKLQGLIDTQALDAMSLLKPEVKRTDAIIKKGATKIDSEQLWASGYKRGLFLSYNKIEDLFGQTPMGAIFGTSPEKSVMKTLAAPFGGKAHEVATRVSEHREHFVRMAHYIAAVEKKVKPGTTQQQLEKIFDDAAHEVRKYHPDGTDLTQFEQRVRVLIPFYAWTRKEIPLLAQALVQRPAKISAYPKVQRTIAGASGIDVNEDQGMLDPYPNDQLFPDWIRASGIGPIGDPESENPVARFWASFGAKILGLNGPEGYVSINPSNPFNDVSTQLFGYGDPQDSMRGLLNSMNPGVQIPASLAFNQTFSGAPITSDKGGEGVTNYLLRQIPQLGEFSRLTGVKRNDNPLVVDRSKQNLINFFSGLGILGSGPYQKSAEFEAKERAKNANSNK